MDQTEPPEYSAESFSDRGKHPAQMGHYRILQVIGEGGMGIVYEAEQATPVKRRVALKVIKLGMHTREIEARFDAERQALAVMDHPNIATVFDGGVTDEGRPYLAMELVRGVDLVAYCDIRQLGVTDRLNLIIKVCEAVQHAHQKGVIHRDLKPSNVLVSEQEGVPTPKIIDFGIAKGMGRQLTDRTIVTEHGAMVGTPTYMSPEQAEGSGLDVDTRSDIYSIGVMLHELLTGKLPVDPTGMSAAQFMVRLILRDTPQPLPSATFAALEKDDALRLAQFRSIDTHGLLRALKGDLDWIVIRAIEKDRSRRYETANALALDIKRYLADEPVRARPPDMWHTVQKFVRRNRVAVAAASTVTAVLIVGFIATATALRRVQRAEVLAAQEAQAASEVADFLVGLFSQANPAFARGEVVTAVKVLEIGAQDVRTRLEDRPLLQARMLTAMGSAFEGLGQYDEGRKSFADALELWERELGPSSEPVVRALINLGNVLRILGEYARAESSLTRAASIIDVNSIPIKDRGDLANNLGGLYLETGKFAVAESLLSDAAQIFEELNGPDDALVATALSNLGAVYLFQGLFAKAESTLSRSLDIRREQLPEYHPFLADVLNNLGATYWYQGEYERAEPFYRQTFEIFERTLGPDHLDTGKALNNLGETYWKMEDLERAETFLRRALQVKTVAVGPDHVSVSATLNLLANVLRDRGSEGEADEMYGRALAIREDVYGPNAPPVREILQERATLYRQMGRVAEAERIDSLIAAHDN